LAEEHPELKEEWNYNKNGDLTPEKTTSGSDLKVWWVCILGHEWEATISSRSNGTGCPICRGESATSFAEQAIYFYLKRLFIDSVNRYKVDGVHEIDIFIPSKKIGIEYDGLYYHASKRAKIKERNKDDYCRNHGIELIRIKETKEKKMDEGNVIYCKYDCNYDYLKIVIKKILKRLSFKNNDFINIDIMRDKNIIKEQYIFSVKEKSISNMFPQLLNEWNYEKNGNIKPE
jgi:hypothetical protein